MTPSSRASTLKASASIAAKLRVVELAASGRRIIDLTVGEPEGGTPRSIVEAAVEAPRRGDTHYTGSAGSPALRRAICAKLAAENGLAFDPGEVIVANGAKQVISEAFAATVDEGDEVIIPAPYWVSYPEMVRLNGGVPVVVPCPERSGHKLTPEALEGAITSRTRWLVINSPCNPTGAVYTAEEWRRLIEVLRRHPHVHVMSDELYEHLVFDGRRNVSPGAVDPDMKARVLVVNGMSKTYAMTGWRIGYGAGPKELIATMVKLAGQSTTCASSFGQTAATAALEGDQSSMAALLEAHRRRRDLIHARLNAVHGVRCPLPMGAFYVFLTYGLCSAP